MQIRAADPSDLPTLTDLTIEVFGPFYEQSFRSMVPPDVFRHQHGSWADDYRRDVPMLLDPAHDKLVAIAQTVAQSDGRTDGQTDGEVIGYVAWNVDRSRRHGSVEVLAVRPTARRTGTGRALCEHAFAAMRALDVEVVGIGTGGDDFHAPARALYEALGFSRIPIAGYLRAIE